jgi:hypothetical protein
MRIDGRSRSSPFVEFEAQRATQLRRFSATLV